MNIKPVSFEQSTKYVTIQNGFGSYEVMVQKAQIDGVFGSVFFEKYDTSYWQVVWTISTHNIQYDWWSTVYKPSKNIDDVVGLLQTCHDSLMMRWLDE